MKYLIQNGIAVIPKSSRRSRMIENIDLFVFELTEVEMAIIKELDGGKQIFSWY